MGEVFAKDVEWDLKHPCSDCPFLKTSPYHEGVAGSLSLYMESISNNRFAHTCHKTDRRPACDGPHTWEGEPKHCVGAMMMLLKTGNGMDLQLPMLEAAEAGKIDVAALTAQAQADGRVFTVPKLLAFYHREIGRRLRSFRKSKDSPRRGKKAF